jgi:hypothetical protein
MVGTPGAVGQAFGDISNMSRCYGRVGMTAIVLAIATFQNHIKAQEFLSPPPVAETFKVTNDGKDEIAVYMRGRSPDGRALAWQDAVKIPQGWEATIPLHGFEPFDIAIREVDGSFLLATNIELCTWMRVCATTGRSSWIMPFSKGRWIKDRSGRERFIQEMKARIEIESAADEAEVSIRFSQVDHDPPRKPKLPPKK